jgi:hypothetical protein
MKAYWEVEVELHAFLTSALDGGERSASNSGSFKAGEITLGTHWIRGCVGLRLGVDMVTEKKKSPLLTLAS